MDFKDFMGLYKKCTEKIYFLINTTLSSDNPLRFRKNLLEEVQITVMTIDHKIIEEKLQYNISRAAAKISVLSSGKIDKHEYPTGKEVLPPQQYRIIKKAKNSYSGLKKALEKKQKLLIRIVKSRLRNIQSLESPRKVLPSISSQKRLFNTEIMNKLEKF